ncbi:MAG TPA: hypothetical protein VMU50_17295 [Polyangia bacterium]|nr:hypothetical protein [Polyangia bacterium]
MKKKLGGKRGWILGAGFSRPLNGPLLDDLLRFLPKWVVKAGLPTIEGKENPTLEDFFALRSEVARAYCRYGMAQGHWSNPEEFIDHLESAAVYDPKSSIRRTIQSLVKSGVHWPKDESDLYKLTTLEDLVNAGREAVVADCWKFLDGQKVSEDRWLPYRKWAESLTRDDTIISFNYDAVPEILMAHPGSKLVVIPPKDNELNEENKRIMDDRQQFVVRKATENDRAIVLKLHGSINWSRDKFDRLKVAEGNTAECLSENGTTPIIGFPGPSKVSRFQTELGPFWKHAEDALGVADHVYFMGYSIPATDAASRDLIVRTVSDSRSGPVLHIVLKSSSNPAAKRLQEILTDRVSSEVRSYDMGCEDFLDVFEVVPYSSRI